MREREREYHLLYVLQQYLSKKLILIAYNISSFVVSYKANTMYAWVIFYWFVATRSFSEIKKNRGNEINTSIRFYKIKFLLTFMAWNDIKLDPTEYNSWPRNWVRVIHLISSNKIMTTEGKLGSTCYILSLILFNSNWFTSSYV